MTADAEPIAVVGAAGRFPGAADIDQLWDGLCQGRESVASLSEDDLLAAGVPAEDVASPAYVRAAALLPHVDEFDADLFGMSAAEADACDPLLRLFLEIAHGAIEDAGYAVERAGEGMGVFGSAGPGRPGRASDSSDCLAPFVSHRLDLRGPAVTIGGAGAGSLLAVHLACQSLRLGECDSAIAGGASIELPHGRGYWWSPGGGLAPDGHCRPFDATGAGTVPGSGAGAVLLKRLSDAVADGDYVRAVIRASAIASGGARGVPFGVPGAETQAAAVVEAMAVAGCDPSDVSCVEAHAAGRAPDDAVELAALAAAYARLANGGLAERSIPVGSVKSNVGHLGRAAGIVSLVKVALALERGRLPPSINVALPNPGLRAAGTPLRVADVLLPWPRRPGRPRVAGVSAAGAGTYVHAVVEEGPGPALTPHGGRPRVVVWSGRTAAAAGAAAARLAEHFTHAPEEQFADAVATLQQGRTAHPVRGAAVCADPGEAAAALAGGSAVPLPSAPRGVAFLFPGDAVWRPRLAAGLYGAERVFTETMDVCLEAFEAQGLDLSERWLADEAAGAPDAGAERAIVFAVEYALARTWMALGVEPSALVAQGVGEVAAAAVAGVYDPAGAARLVLAPAPEGGPPAGVRRLPVRSAEPAGVAALLDELIGEGQTVLELGPPSVAGRAAAASLGPAGDGCGDDRRHLLAAVGKLWVLGHRVEWAALDRDHPLQRVPVPTYPYQRRRCRPDGSAGAGGSAGLELAGAPPGLPAPAEPMRPLGRLQHAFWILDRLAPRSGVSNIAIAFRAARPLRWWPLHCAVNHLVRRHPALRLRFPEVSGVPVQHLSGADDVEVSIHTQPSTGETLVADLEAFGRAPFDLARDIPFRVAHLTLPEGASVICLVVHHVVGDVVSTDVVIDEMCRLYDGLIQTGAVPPDLREEVAMLAETLPSRDSMRYWLDRLHGVEPEAMVIPGARPTPERPTFAGRTVRRHLSAGALTAMRVLREELRVTDNLVLLSAFCLALLRHGTGPDLVVGVPVGTRRASQLGQVGLGVSTMPLRVRADPAAGFRDLVRRVADAFVEGVEHSDASTEVVLTELGHRSGDWRVPLFRHMFNYRPTRADGARIAGEGVEFVALPGEPSRLDLHYIACPEGDAVSVRATYSTEVHDEADVAAFVERMEVLLQQAAARPDHPVRWLDCHTAGDRAAVEAANRTERTWAGPGTLPERVAAHAWTRPDATAIVAGRREVSYGALMAAAGSVEARLRAAGVRTGDVVALALGRGPELAAAVLGTWAAGASYLPLDVRQPDLRLAFQVDDAGARAVVAAGASPPWAGRRPVVVPEWPVGGSARPGGAAPDPGTPAYVIYTSGSTGRPKGVVVSHRSLANVVLDFAGRLGLDASSSVLWSTTTTFDISALELLLPLAAGGRLVVADDDVQGRPRALLDLVAAHDVAVVQATPTAWRLLAAEATGELAGRLVLCGGEPLPAALARRLLECGCRPLNVYGPTETTIWSTAAEIDSAPRDPVTIGRPIANTRVFVAGRHGEELPPGLPGELCVAGHGVSLGYLGRPELTAERFGEHPRWGRFYRTGDVARLRADGAVEMSGRTDRQVKLRGHRIELGEVEAVLHEHPAVLAAAVTITGDPQADGRLLAFVQPRATGPARAGLRDDLWRFARDRLPDHALPSGIAVVDELPTTPSGKIDYRALEAGAAGETRAGEPGAGTGADLDPDLTRLLVQLWRRTLGRPHLGEHDNFFLHGGQSLAAVRLTNQLEDITGRPLPVRVLFDHPTPAELSAHLAGPAGAPP